MAFYGTNPTGGYFKMTPRATVPTFPGTYGHSDKEGTFYFNDGSGTITAGLWVYQGTGFAAITKNTDATELITGQLAPARGGVPVGTIIAWAGASTGTGTGAPPTGYILCNGSTPGGTGAYAALYDAIGNKWGGTDAASMKIPDLRGKFIRMVDHGAGNDPNASTRVENNTGGNTGDNVGSYQADEFKSHTHSYIYLNGGVTHGQSGSVHKEDPSSETTGATGGSETRPKNVYVEFYIKYIST
jgi:microcystin-dependent protein